MLLSLLTGVPDTLREHFLNIHNLTCGLGAERKGRAFHATRWAGGSRVGVVMRKLVQR